MNTYKGLTLRKSNSVEESNFNWWTIGTIGRKVKKKDNYIFFKFGIYEFGIDIKNLGQIPQKKIFAIFQLNI